MIDGRNVLGYKGKDHADATQQIVAIGFNGTSGALDETSESRLLKIDYTWDDHKWSEQQRHRVYQHVGTTPSPDEIAETIARQINFDKAAGGSDVKAEILLDEAGATLTTSGTSSSWSVVNGSPIAQANGTLGTTNFAVGDYVRIDSASSPSTQTIGVYKIASIDTTNNRMTFTMPYQGTTDSSISEATDINVITGAVADAAEAGILLTGESLEFTPGFFNYRIVSFNVGMPTADWGSTTFTTLQSPYAGQGTYEQVADAEWIGLGYEGALNRTIVPLPTGRTDADSAKEYDTVTIYYFDDSENNVISGKKPAPQGLYIFLVDAPSNGLTTALLAQLNPWMASLPNSLAPVTL
jgi:hypothetical protein